MAPEAALAALAPADKRAYVRALLPLVRRGCRIERRNLRRLYQLCAFMDISAADRVELMSGLEDDRQPPAELVRGLPHSETRRSLVEEADMFARNAPSSKAFDYVALLRISLNLRRANSRKLTQLLEKLTDIENRAATLLSKPGHIVRLDDRRLEIVKKGVAAVAVPSAVLFPLGTVGLSIEGITTGLIALGGGFILPAGIAMMTGLGSAIAVGITTKRLLDMLIPTIDADRASIDVQHLQRAVVELRGLLDEIAEDRDDKVLREHARARIATILNRIAPLTNAQRTRIESSLEHTRILSDRYLKSLEHDCGALEQHHHSIAHELDQLLDSDLRALSMHQA